MSTATGPNAEQILYWSDVAGPKWVSDQSRLDAQIRDFGQKAFAKANIQPGHRVLDVGCGCGQTTLELARLVGSTGHVTGIDVSSVMLDQARLRATASNIDNVVFLAADAQTAALPQASFDLVYSRFGVMFFSDTQAAFSNLKRTLRAQGRFIFVCWRSIEDNPWMHIPLRAVQPHVQPPPLPPFAPGPCALADANRLRQILHQAGFIDIQIEPYDTQMLIAGGGSLQETLDMILQHGLAARAIRDAPPDVQAAARTSIERAIRPLYGPDGLRLGAAMWLVSATCSHG